MVSSYVDSCHFILPINWIHQEGSPILDELQAYKSLVDPSRYKPRGSIRVGECTPLWRDIYVAVFGVENCMHKEHFICNFLDAKPFTTFTGSIVVFKFMDGLLNLTNNFKRHIN